MTETADAALRLAEGMRLETGNKASTNHQTLRQCFVIGPFGKDRSPVRKWSDALMDKVVRPLLIGHGYQANRSIDLSRPRDITQDLLNMLLKADLVIADLTGANANVYYELAVRHATERPFIQVIQAGEQLPFDIMHLDVLALPVRKQRGIALPDGQKCMDRLRPYIQAVHDGSASYASPLAAQSIGKTLRQSDTESGAAHPQPADLLGRLPASIQAAFTKFAVETPLYYKDFSYEIELFHSDGIVTYQMDVAFEIMNMSDHAQTVINRYPTPGKQFELKFASIDNRPVDLNDKSLYSQDAFLLKYAIPGRRSSRFKVVMTKPFQEYDSDFFTAYLYPAERFSFHLVNRSSRTLDVWLEMLHSQNELSVRDGDKLTWTAIEPIFPYQGVRMLWRPKHETSKQRC